ncbi:MAG: methyltransferase domain-containing protein [Alphaproteobacteria bacterium]|nr:methyltransferase domain-containing protein [Alphaproteobacteria bacterium]
MPPRLRKLDRATELAVVRRAYAKQVLAAAGVANADLEVAYAHVRREDFLGAGPWLAITDWAGGYARTPSDDPVYLYVDSVFAILPDRHLNNGQPSGHAKWLVSAAIKPGHHVVHVGTGTGYYTAIMAELVGPSGRVTGIEFDPELAVRSRRNLAPFAQVRVIQGDGATVPLEATDVIYVNAGVTHPAGAWLDGLTEGGRLVVPLTTNRGFTHNVPPVPIERRGAYFCIERQVTNFRATWVSPVAIISCANMRDRASEAALEQAFASGRVGEVKWLRRGGDVPAQRCWLRAPGWCLTYD